MNERITVTLPQEIVREIDRLERDRSKLVLQAAARALPYSSASQMTKLRSRDDSWARTDSEARRSR